MTKANVLIKNGDIEQANETIQRILSQDTWNMKALVLNCLLIITRENKPLPVINALKDLNSAVEMLEPKNGVLCYQISSLFSRLACGNRE